MNTNNQNNFFVLYSERIDVWQTSYLAEDFYITRNVEKAKKFKTYDEAVSFLMKNSLEDFYDVAEKQY